MSVDSRAFRVVDHVLRASACVVLDRLLLLLMARVTSESSTAARVWPRAARKLSPWGVRVEIAW